MQKKRTKNHKKRTFKEEDEQVKDLTECKNTKTVYEFHPCRIASITIFNRKMLMFAKLSLMSFIYELTETFMFLSAKTKSIFEKYFIDFIYAYQLLSDTDSTSLQFIIFSKDES